MDVWNPGKNRWRYKEGSDEKIIEIELTKGQIALIDAERLEEVQKYKWSTFGSTERNTRYARTQIPYSHPVDGGKYKFMHIMLFPDVLPPRDHINHNGLDNTTVNIRSGARGINERNRISKKQNIGILDLPHRKQYRAVWRETNGRPMDRTFSWSKYATKELAYKAAVECQKTNSDRIMKELEDINNHHPEKIIQKYVPTRKEPKSGLKHIMIRKSGPNTFYAVVEIVINNKKFSKSFSASFYDDDLDKAIDAAKEWLEKIKEENPRKRKIDNE